MNLASKTAITNLLKGAGIVPSRGLGQNFLIDRGAIKKIIEAANLPAESEARHRRRSEDAVLEIGPGLGVLTWELAKAAKKVVAVEKDLKMVEILKETLRDFNNVEVIRGDIRQIENYQIENYQVVGNLPFYLTAPVIRQFLESVKAKPRQLVLVVQKEVAQRICARPPKMNLLAVSVQFYSEPKIISYLSRKSFWPAPRVDAAIIKITPKAPAVGERDLFFKIVKAGFSHPRKQLINNLSKGLKLDKKKVTEWLLKNGLRPDQRAETLTMKDWVNLVIGS